MTEKTEKKMLCSLEQVSDLFGVTKACICDWVKKGMPKEAERGIYSVKDCFVWWFNNINTGPEDSSNSISEAKRKYWIQKAKGEELKNLTHEGRLIPSEKIFEEWVKRAADLKTSLMALNARMASVLSNKTAIQINSLLKTEITKMLDSFCRESSYCPALSEKSSEKKIVKPTVKKKSKKKSTAAKKNVPNKK